MSKHQTQLGLDVRADAGSRKSRNLLARPKPKARTGAGIGGQKYVKGAVGLWPSG